MYKYSELSKFSKFFVDNNLQGILYAINILVLILLIPIAFVFFVVETLTKEVHHFTAEVKYQFKEINKLSKVKKENQ